MNIDYLKEFIDLSETFSFSATARRFYVSSSVLSKHISAMEKELAVKLLRRDSHGVELT
ncbi:helix-turn-helix domain-containing protein, partial [Ellagibacter isourolithinifaciens]|uniref:helix-turn-helix domain-containing protein n=3 Tax=Ellagibacter TaxID=2137577 RepID=UPI003AAD5814